MVKETNDDFIHVMTFSISSETMNWGSLVPETCPSLLYPTTLLIKAIGSLFIPKWKESDIS